MKCKNLVDVGRRKFLQGSSIGAATAAVSVFAGAAPSSGQTLARLDYPSTRLGSAFEMQDNMPLDIEYPDENSPGILLKLGERVEGGVGPDGDIVAFSILCPHKGWSLTYNPSDKTLNCPGHFSRFDCEANGQQTWGHATQNLPQFILRVDDQGDIFAEGVDELIYGRLSNTLYT